MGIVSNIKQIVKNNRYIRGIYFLYHNYFGYSRKQFGYIADDVTLTPPLTITNPKNVFLYVIMVCAMPRYILLTPNL